MNEGDQVLPQGRHNLGFAATDASLYWRDGRGQLRCAHGVLLYGTNCVRCERGDFPPFARPGETQALERAEREFGSAPRRLDYPDQTGMRDFPLALEGPLMAALIGFCVGVTENRPPNQVIGRAGSPYIDRWYLARKATVPAFSVAPDYADAAQCMPSEVENLYLHGYRRSDADVPHDHPWPNASLVVRGWYREDIYNLEGRLIGNLTRRAGDTVLRAAGSIHAIIETSGDCLSLFATLPKEREWGFWTADGFKPWREFGNP